MRRLLAPIILLLGLLAGCATKPVSTSSTNNKDVSVGLLFEHDGCRVYRFDDYGEFHYYVVCQQGSSQATMTDYCTGKNCNIHISDPIQTVIR